MWTSHGHHIPGTDRDDAARPDYVSCGGIGNCDACDSEAEVVDDISASVLNTTTKTVVTKSEFVEGKNLTMSDRARKLVHDYIRATSDTVPAMDDIYVVWFSKTLQNWKALVSTNLPDNMYYEITHSGDLKVTYLDAYRKVANVSIPD